MQQDRECWVVAQGRSIIGPVAVWRNPVVGPADLQIWTAKSWPKEMWAIPNNAIICTTRGPGITALGGGDYDGDTLFVTANVHLLNYLDATEAAVQALPMEEAGRVRERLSADAKTAWDETDARSRALQYMQHVHRTPTPNVRGVATWYAELAQAGTNA